MRKRLTTLATIGFAFSICFTPTARSWAGIHYQGKVYINGMPFNGIGLFKFSVFEENNAVVWDNDGLKTAVPPVPKTFWRLPVTNGNYQADLEPLGASLKGAALLASGHGELRIRVWFNDQIHGWAQLTPDANLRANLPSEVPQKADESALESKVDILLKEVRQIRTQLNYLQGKPSPAAATDTVPVDARRISTIFLNKGDTVMGSSEATIAVLEFSDFQCHYCRKFAEETFPKLKSQFIDTGRIKFVSKQFPLSFHGQANQAAKVALCAGDQGQYWHMQELLFQKNNALRQDFSHSLAEDSGLDVPKFEACLSSSDTSQRIEADIAQAKSLGIRGTPSFFIGKIQPNGEVRGQVLVGAKSLDEFETRINQLALDER